jgi:hypothetical protein
MATSGASVGLAAMVVSGVARFEDDRISEDG